MLGRHSHYGSEDLVFLIVKECESNGMKINQWRNIDKEGFASRFLKHRQEGERWKNK